MKLCRITFRRGAFSKVTLRRMTSVRMTLRILISLTLNITTLGRMTLSKERERERMAWKNDLEKWMAFLIMTLSSMTFRKMPLCRMSLNRMALSRMIVHILICCHILFTVQLSEILLNVVLLIVVQLCVMAPLTKLTCLKVATLSTRWQYLSKDRKKQKMEIEEQASLLPVKVLLSKPLFTIDNG
jgi:hypothetical protein